MLLTHYDDVNTITITTFFYIFSYLFNFLTPRENSNQTAIYQIAFISNCVDIGYLRLVAVIKHKIKLKMLTKLLFQLQKRALIH